jgi:hypothetical protein
MGLLERSAAAPVHPVDDDVVGALAVEHEPHAVGPAEARPSGDALRVLTDRQHRDHDGVTGKNQ